VAVTGRQLPSEPFCQLVYRNVSGITTPGKWNNSSSIACLGLTCAGWTIQLVNIHRPLAAHQESMHSYTSNISNAPPLSVFDPISTLDFPTSPCTSLYSSAWSDSKSPPTQRRQHPDGHDTARISGLLSAPALPTVVPSIPKTAPPACTCQSLEAPGPGQLSIISASPPAPDPSTPREALGRRVPKQRRVARHVRLLACFFCRRRKIACEPPAKLSSDDPTCKYVLTHLPFPLRLMALATSRCPSFSSRSWVPFILTTL
jgi:hypothetical protein